MNSKIFNAVHYIKSSQIEVGGGKPRAVEVSMVGRRFVAVKVEEAMNHAIKIEDKKSAIKLHDLLCTIMDSMDCTSNIKLSDEDIKKMYNELKEDLFIYL